MIDPTGFGAKTAAIVSQGLLFATMVACRDGRPAGAAAGVQGTPFVRQKPPQARSLREELIGCIVALVHRARRGGVSPAAAAALCNGSVSTTGVPTSWLIRTRFNDLTVMANDAPRPDEAAAEFDLAVGLEADVRLSDLISTFGAYRTVFESKTSSVSFDGPVGTGPVFADLLSSKPSTDSVVIRVVARATSDRSDVR